MSSRTSQPRFVRPLFASPAFQDPEIARSSKVLITSLFAAVAILLVLVVLAPFVNADPIPPLVVYALLLAITGVAFRLLHRGRVRLASHVLVWTMLVVAAGDAFVAGGIRGPTVPFLFVVLVLAGLTLGNRALLASTVLAGVIGVVIAGLEAAQVFVSTPISPLRMAAASLAGFAGVGVLVHLALLSDAARLRVTEQLRRVIDTTMDGFVLIGADGRFLEANPAFCDMAGFSPAELRSQAVTDIDAQMSAAEISEQFHTVVRQGTDRFETRMRRSNGSLVDVEMSAVAMSVGEEPPLVAVFVRDVTDRRRADEALRESEARYRGLFENSRDAIYVTTIAGAFEEANATMCKLFGFTRSELPTVNARDLYANAADRERFSALISRSGSVSDFPVLLQKSNGDQLECLVTASARRAADGTIMAYEGIVRDVTTQAQTERALRESEEKYRVLYENAPVGIGLADAEGNLLTYNDAMLEPGGYKRGDPQLANVANLYVTKDDRVKALQCLAERGSVQQMEVRFRRGGEGAYDALLSLGQVTVEGKQCVMAIVQDVTQRKQAERALADSRQMLRLVLDAIPVRVFWKDRNSVYLGCNRLFAEDAGRKTPQALVGKRDFELSWTNRAEEYRRDDMEVMESGRPKLGFEDQVLHHDGSDRWVQTSKVPLCNMEGHVIGILGTYEDITERREAEQAVRMSEARFATAFGLSPDAVVISRLSDGCMIDVNESFVRMTGYDRSEAVGHTAHELGLWGEDHSARDRFVSRLQSGQGARDIEVKFFGKGGESFICLLSGDVIDLDGEPHVFFYGKNITERKKAEEEVRHSREQLRRLAVRLQSVREQERAAIAREIHDELGQGLTGMKMDLSWMVGRLPPTADELLKRGESMMELMDTTIQTVRDLSTRLRPAVLDDLGLAAAVEWQSQETAKRSGLEIILQSTADTGDLDRERATALFRILQEALTNVVRHADAKRTTVALQISENDVILEVVDDGCGIAEDQLESLRSLGILGMRERALEFGGTVHIVRGLQGGTAVTARMPRRRQVDDA